MTIDKDNEPGNPSGGLLAWWLAQIAKVSGVTARPASSEGGDSPLPFPLGQMGQALQLTQQLIGPLYQGYFQALLANPNAGEAFIALQDVVRKQMEGIAGAFGSVAPGLGTAQTLLTDGWSLLNGPMEMFNRALAPLSLNVERAYGGLADAFGLAPSRDLQGAAREWATASLGKQEAQAKYMRLVVGAMAKGSDNLLVDLRAMGQRGESIDSLLGLVRLWARAIDQSMHVALQSPDALEASAQLVRAGSRVRQQKHRIVAIASEALNIPTRAEVDGAYKEIQELKRQLRRLRKPVPATAALEAPVAPGAVAVQQAKPDAVARRARPRPAAAKRSKSTKGTA